jgi:hypothetical protein
MHYGSLSDRVSKVENSAKRRNYEDPAGSDGVENAVDLLLRVCSRSQEPRVNYWY